MNSTTTTMQHLSPIWLKEGIQKNRQNDRNTDTQDHIYKNGNIIHLGIHFTYKIGHTFRYKIGIIIYLGIELSLFSRYYYLPTIWYNICIIYLAFTLHYSIKY